MKTKADKPGKVEPKVLLLAAGLVLALFLVGLSWRMSQAPASSSGSVVAATTSAEQMSQETARLLSAVHAAQAEDAKAIETSWPVAEAPKVAAPAAKPTEQTFHLRGVVRGGSQPVVFLDDKTLMVGDEIEGYVLTEIAADHVTLVDPQGRKHALSLDGVE
jgi:hypothetical protein